ncbi:cytosolic protein [Halobacillus sp. A1]|uniref:cytosolic protein n=1 Tax=Halobacillus sp. A1 TaxID=2880262 RepID=UPI0020A65928|nr:cytosolic protein [Halobacillus sp. A1]MCP3033397.1 cytosolic protein [Halobacillus sp. A1]
MYVGRDLSELNMMSKKEWENLELSYFHFSLSQMAPYLNQEGVSILREINNEIKLRGGLKQREASWEM